MAKSGPKPKTEKLCPPCGKILPIEAFRYGGLIRHLCPTHYAARQKEWRESDPKRYARIKAWHKQNDDARREHNNNKSKARTRRFRKIVLEHYGGSPPVCACCGESTYEFLALDHKKGGGTKHRKELKRFAGVSTYYWAVKNNFPKIFRVLCHNCNSSLGYYGYCPHKKSARRRTPVRRNY